MKSSQSPDLNLSNLRVDGCLTEEAETLILEKATVLACECPKHLVFLLNKVRLFQEYEKGCIESSIQDRETHEWLHGKGLELDRTISQTIIDLALREGMISKSGEIVEHPKQ